MKTTSSQLLLLLLCMLPELQIIIVQAIPQFDDETYQQIMDDPRTKVETVYTSYSGITTARTSSVLSAFSSVLIILIIVTKSKSRSSSSSTTTAQLSTSTSTSTSYHRLVLGMSVADTIGSLAMFSSTWLMPRDMIYEQFEGAVYGTSSTCAAQGFLFSTGMISTVGFNTSLCVYYVCVMRLKVSEDQFRRFVEPVLISMAVVLPLLITVPLVVLDLFVPSPWDFSCNAETYPWWVKSDSGQIIRYALAVLYFGCTGTIFLSMFIVCWTVYVQERILKEYTKAVYSHRQRHGGGGGERGHGGIGRIGATNRNRRKNRNTGSDAALSRHDDNGGNYNDNCNHNNNNNNKKICTTEEWQTETKIILHQALGYLASLIICQMFPLITILLRYRRRSVILQYLHGLFRPLQGFFNFLIFVGHKVSNQRRADNSLSRWEAFCKVFTSGREEPTLFIGNITMVVRRGDDDDDDMFDISFSDVRDTITPASRGGDDLSTGMFSVDPLSSTLRDSGNATRIDRHDKSHRSETGLSYGESYGDNITMAGEKFYLLLVEIS